MHSRKRVLVTGGAGYVGSHCCKAFAREGWEVVVFDNLSRGWADFVRWGPLIVGDILDGDALRKAMDDVRPSAVAHFAALAYVGESVAQPDIYYRTNVLGTLNVLDAMRHASVENLLFSSTCATYGTPARVPVDETHPQAPINPYGHSKLMAEQVIRDVSGAYGLRHVLLRYFNAAGADVDGEVGERQDPAVRAIQLAVRSAQVGSVFQVYGDDFDTRDGTAVRDYVHVSDLAEAHAKALDYLLAGGASEVLNLGTGVGVTVREIVDAVEAVAGRPIAWEMAPRREGDPACLVAACEKAAAVLGWTAKQSGLDEIVRSAWAWQKADRERNDRQARTAVDLRPAATS
ncbi:MAG TPA: UDP-glucose 4-epimerase GalE [Caulobacteraceae bacterium]